MTLFRFLVRYSPAMVIWTSLAAFVSGGCNAGLIAMINEVLSQHGHVASKILFAFIALGLGRIASNGVAQIMLARFSQATTARMRRDLVTKILSVPLRRLEELTTPRLMVALTEDVNEIMQAMLLIPAFAVNLAILIGGAVYLGFLSLPVLGAMGAFIVCGAVTYRMLIHRGFGHLAAAREGQDRLFRHFRALTEGIKELKLHRVRREAFVREDIESATAVCQRHNVAAESRFIFAQNWSQFLFFVLVAGILFALPRMAKISPTELTGYVIAILYLMGPLSGLLSSLSVFGRASVCLNKVEALGLTLAANAGDNGAAPVGAPEAFETLELAGIQHHYHREREDDHFMLGPIDLSFRPGELVFLAGGNGSGKSTLAKVIAGLYPPAAGEIRLNGRVIGDHNRDDYRQCFSAVFADYHLFDRLIGVPRLGADERARGYLERLHLDHKVSVEDGVFSTVELSTGQRKRLALLCAYLEDRPFFLFDEWASDQDPLFKEVFYTQVLPELRSRGKAVLVITHDDKYFPLADRLIKLDYGRLTGDERPGPVPNGIAPGGGHGIDTGAFSPDALSASSSDTLLMRIHGRS
ncbi:MAG: cyclic peptide export ABC transporter [Opitutaceae bacterium]